MMTMKPISRVLDDELYARRNAVRAMIRRSRKADTDSKDAEVELCYIEREQEVRELRRELHKEYVANQNLTKERGERRYYHHKKNNNEEVFEGEEEFFKYNEN